MRNAKEIAIMQKVADQLTESEFRIWQMKHYAEMQDDDKARQYAFMKSTIDHHSKGLAELDGSTLKIDISLMQIIVQEVIQCMPHVHLYYSDEMHLVEDDLGNGNGLDSHFVLFNGFVGCAYFPYSSSLSGTQLTGAFDHHKKLEPGMGDDMPYSLICPELLRGETLGRYNSTWLETFALCNDLYFEHADFDHSQCTLYFRDEENYLEASLLVNS